MSSVNVAWTLVSIVQFSSIGLPLLMLRVLSVKLDYGYETEFIVNNNERPINVTRVLSAVKHLVIISSESPQFIVTDSRYA